MPKAKVQLPKGTESIRIHRVDNTHFDLKTGDVVELDDVPGRQREERLMDKHFIPIPDPVPQAKADAAPPVKGKK